MPSLREQIEQLLRAHLIYHPAGALCCCGWEPHPLPQTTRGQEDAHREHVAGIVAALLDQPSAERAVVMAFALHLDMLRGTATPLRAGNHVSEAEAWLRVRAVLAASPPEPTNG